MYGSALPADGHGLRQAAAESGVGRAERFETAMRRWPRGCDQGVVE